MRKPGPASLAFVGVLALAAFLRFEHGSEVARRDVLARIPAGDEHTFDAWAARVAQGRDEAIPYQAPLYPTLVGGLARVSASKPVHERNGVPGLEPEPLAAARLSGALLGLLASLLAARLALLATGDRRAALVAFALCALAKPLVYYEATLLREAAAAALLAALALAYAKARESASATDHAALGLALGLGVVLRENFVLVLAVVLVERTFALVRQTPGRERAGALALLVVGAALPIVHFDAKVWRLGDGVHPLPHWNSGCILYQSNRRDHAALGGYEKAPFVPFANADGEAQGFHSEAERRLGRSLGFHETEAFWRTEALREVAGEPLLFFKRALDRALRSLVPWEEAHQRDPDLDARGSWVLRAPLVGQGALVLLALAGLIFAPFSRRGSGAASGASGERERATRGAVGILLLAWWASFLFAAFTTRYRVAAIPLLAVVAAQGGLALARIVRERRAGPLVALALLAGFLLVFLPWKRAPHDVSNGLRTRALALMEAGEFGAAAADFDEASFLREDRDADLLAHLGEARVRSGAPRLARAAYGRACALAPGESAPLAGLALAELALGRPRAAVSALEAAIARSGGDPGLARTLEIARRRAAAGADASLPAGESDPARATVRARSPD
ncbi:glycosyltransferase family 39 protein [bacterium]|nr:glycosyltransferase family 39 protein [bacterium]